MAESTTIAERLNILILGEKGAGKSALLKAIKNFSTQSSLIKSSIERGSIQAQSNTENESSLIKECIFVSKNIEIHIFNTPGIKKDHVVVWNLETVRSKICKLNNLNLLHGILVLVRLNNAEFQNLLKLCLNEVQDQLGKEACKNITFVFTKRDTCNYQVESIIAYLNNILNEMDLTDVLTVGRDTVFCLEDDNINFLQSLKGPISVPNLADHFKWYKSSKEIEKLIEHMKTRRSQVSQEINFKKNELLHCESTSACLQPNNEEEVTVDASGFEGLNSTKCCKQKGESKYLKELNVLLFGEAGVVKSTFINALANYLKFDTFEEAKDVDPVYAIASQFVTTVDQDCITSGSEIQQPKSYFFISKDSKCKLCLIDIPAIGDTTENEQEKDNVKSIMGHLSHLKEIHGIFILLMPDQIRLPESFTFIFHELLLKLHKDACNNFAFIFTNVHTTDFIVDDTVAMLRKIIEDNNLENELKACVDTSYYLDNVAVRYLAEVQTGVQHTDQEYSYYEQSWKYSCNESQRLLLYINKVRPHSTEANISINNIRQLVVGMAKSLAHMAVNIQEAIDIVEEKNNELKQFKDIVQYLSNKLRVAENILECKECKPRLICHSLICNDTAVIDNIPIKIPKQICHENCTLRDTGLKYKRGNKKTLISYCKVFNTGMCRVCKCSWRKHERVTYDVVKTTKEVVDPIIKARLELNNDTCTDIEVYIREIRKDIQQLKWEQDKLIVVAAKCEVFIEKNSMNDIEDAFKKSLEVILNEHESMPRSGRQIKIFIALRKVLGQYFVVKQNFKSSGLNQTLSNVYNYVLELFEMPITGSTIKQILDAKEIENHQIDIDETI